MQWKGLGVSVCVVKAPQGCLQHGKKHQGKYFLLVNENRYRGVRTSSPHTNSFVEISLY